MASIVPSERLQRELHDLITGVGEEDDPIEAIVQGVYEELADAEANKALALLAERFGRVGEEGRTARRDRAGGRATVCFRVRIRDATGRAVQR